MKIENQEQLQKAFQQLETFIAEGFEGDYEKEIAFKSIALAIALDFLFSFSNIFKQK